MAGTASDMPSPPLYLAGLVITFCGIIGVSAALSTTDDVWMLDLLVLTCLGFALSFGSRRLGIAARYLDLGFAALTVLLLLATWAGQFDVSRFLPVGNDTNNDRLLAGLAWLSTLWAWNLRCDNRVMGTTVPAMAALGLAATIDLNNPVLICFGLFILTVIFLLIHQNYLQNRARAARSEWEPAARRLLGAQLVQAGLCALLVLLTGKVVIVPIQAIFARLSLAQAMQQLTALGPRAPLGGNAALHFSDDDNLEIGTGDAWSASSEVVMRVTPSDGQEHYWRGRTYDKYTGTGWQSSLEEEKQPLGGGLAIDDGAAQSSYEVPPALTPGDQAAPSAAPPLTASFRVLGDTSQFYYAANPRRIMLNIDLSRYNDAPRDCRDGRLDLTSLSPVRFTYAVVSQPSPDSLQPDVQERLRRAGTAYPPEVRHYYLPAMDNGVTQAGDIAFFRQAVREALQGLPPTRRDPLDEALAIRAWVSNRCVYSLAVPRLPDDADHVHAFLGDTRRGYCDMFASSMAILCRTAGIPARLATGFAPGDPDGDSFNLRGEDKHAWTEVYFPHTGWVAFDATMGTRTDGSVPNATQKGGDWLSHLHLSLGYGWEFIGPLLAVILLIVGYVLKTEWYDRQRGARAACGEREGAPRTALGAQYRRMSHALARLGLPRRASETPAEYAARAAPFLTQQERELGVPLSPALVTDLSGAFARACYAPSASGSVDTDAWEQAVKRFDAAAWTAQWRRLWRRVTRPTESG